MYEGISSGLLLIACEIQVPIGSVSRKHAKITVFPDYDASNVDSFQKVGVEDLNTKYGTYVNGKSMFSALFVKDHEMHRISESHVYQLEQRKVHSATGQEGIFRVWIQLLS